MKEFKDIKFYIGPMTQNIIDATIEVAEENNIRLGFIPSRRQIEWNGGYTGYNTFDFIRYVKNKTDNVLLCRDHGGLFQGDITQIPSIKSLDLKSFICDAAWGMDLIHIDPWKIYSKPEQYELGLNETINNIVLINQIDYRIQFEIGTEEAIKPYQNGEFFKLLADLKYELGDIFQNIKYAVIQSGTRLEKTQNTGNFNLQKLINMVKICKDFNILSKEHNGDYLTDEEIKIRFDNGLDAINIAPEFGVIETKVLLDHIKNQRDFEKIYNICLSGNKWRKWVNLDYFNPSEQKKELIEICGHYHNKQIKEIVKINDKVIKNVLRKRLYELINL